jgi:hypothetical protein
MTREDVISIGIIVAFLGAGALCFYRDISSDNFHARAFCAERGYAGYFHRPDAGWGCIAKDRQRHFVREIEQAEKPR